MTSVYNLKRRITDTPPISLAEFEKQAGTKGDENSTQREPSSPAFRKSCGACRRRYTTLKSWQEHLKSEHHTQILSSGASPMSDESSPDEPGPEHFSLPQCLFCNFESDNQEDNISHMSHAHSFFIPDIDYLIDLESFLRYLFSIIAEFHECLFCESVKQTKAAVQDHMRAKGHCKLNFESEVHGLHQFYVSKSEDEEGEVEGNSIEAVELEGDELRLPSGRVLGHRSRARYFRQHHSKESKNAEPDSLLQSSSSELTTTKPETSPAKTEDRRLVMRAGTSTSIVGISEQQQRALRAVEKKIMKTETRIANHYQHVLEKGGNKQKWYKEGGIGKKQGGLERRLG